MSRVSASGYDPVDRERRRMAAILDEITDLVGTAGPDGYLRYVNRAGRQLVGIGPGEDVSGLHISSFHPPWAVAKSVEEGIPEAIREGTWTGESALLARSGEEIPVEQVVIAHRGPDGEVTDISTVARDLRETRRVEEELRTSRERMRTILEHSSNVFFSCGPEGEVLYASPQTREIFDCDPEEALRGWRDFLTDHPDNRMAAERTRRALETGNEQPVYELEMESATGRRLWVEVNEAPVVEDGEVVAIVGALTDITARKEAEQRRRELEEQLRQGQRLEAVGRLAGGVAHDFNNLLTAIRGYTELLLDRVEGDGESRDDLREIARAADRASALTGQLLAFSRRQVLEREILDLNSVVREMEKMLRRLIGEDLELVTRLTPGLDRIEADRGQLEQVILNLALNARDAMPRGGRLLIETAQAEVDEAHQDRRPAVSPGRYVMLAVSDTGEGMDRETREHLFEPFFTTKEPGEGTGLGLATVHGIVHQSGGHVFVYSEPQEGSTFKVYLPRTEKERQDESELQVAADEHRGEETVLVCEDDDSVRRLVVEVLTQRGYEVLEAATGREATTIAAEFPGSVDLLLSDVVLPDVRGPDLEARLQAEHPEVRFLFVSGYTGGTIRMRDDWNGDREFLQKPFTPSVLASRIREVLDEPRAGT